MSPLRMLTIALDVLLVIMALLALYYRPRLGGQLAVGLRLLMLGVFILSLTHLADTTLNSLMTIDRALNSVLHRGLNLIGFIIIFVGFFLMRQAFEA